MSTGEADHDGNASDVTEKAALSLTATAAWVPVAEDDTLAHITAVGQRMEPDPLSRTP